MKAWPLGRVGFDTRLDKGSLKALHWNSKWPKKEREPIQRTWSMWEKRALSKSGALCIGIGPGDRKPAIFLRLIPCASVPELNGVEGKAPFVVAARS